MNDTRTTDRSGSAPLHGSTAVPTELSSAVTSFIEQRIAGPSLGRTRSPDQMNPLLDGLITAGGLGPIEAWQRFVEHVVPNTVALDSERYLAFIPVAPSAAGVWMEAAVGAATFSAESWLEAAGVVAAENQTLRWVADLMGLGADAGGCFMSGGSIGNLSALAVAREHMGHNRAVAVADSAHASVRNSLHLLGLTDVVTVPTRADGRFTAESLSDTIGERRDIGIVIASAGSTNAGVVDDLSGLADVAESCGAWLHVDGAYGAAALLVDECRGLFAGIERADSVIVDPHKWLFAPLGSCALLYRRPELAARVHTQHGPYIDVLHGTEPLWNPSDFGYQLTRRASGLPLWFSLVSYGIEAHADAVASGIRLARYAARRLAATPRVSLVMEPQLSVVLFRREHWTAERWQVWAGELLAAGVAFVAPTTWRGEVVGRLVFLHPHTPESVIDEIARSLDD